MPNDIDVAALEEELSDLENVKDEADEEASSPTIYNISSYGADFSVEQHVKRMNNGAYLIPDFQRSYVWTPRKASRFIESLLLGLPVPSVFLYKDDSIGKHLVIDGQQRLKTMQYFVRGTLGEKKFRLSDVHTMWLNKTYEDLNDIDRQKFDDAIVHTIFFKQDVPNEDKSSVYHVFQRINTGGMNLTPQEIRSCVAHGSFVALLKKLNSHQSWREIYGKVSPRMKDQELILRFFALYFRVNQYERPMTDFLDGFMSEKANMKEKEIEQFARLFIETVSLSHKSLGRAAFRPSNALNAAVYDACMVGVARRLKSNPNPDHKAIRMAYDKLLKDQEFQGMYQKATADKDSVIKRIEQATSAFGAC